MRKRINKVCPFCYNPKYSYKTKNGLMRHVARTHLHDDKGRWVAWPFQDAKQLRVDRKRGYDFVPISGWREVEEFLEDYISEFKNPSKKSSRLWNYVRTGPSST